MEDRDLDRIGWSQLWRGATLLPVLTVGVLAIFFLDDLMRDVAEGPQLHVAAAEARNLELGAQVWVAGVPAGRVVAVGFRRPVAPGGKEVLVRAVLSRDGAELMRSDASAAIREAALLEPSVLAIQPGTSPEGFDFADTLTTRELLGPEDVLAGADTLSDRLDELAPVAEELGARLRDGPGTLASLTDDPGTLRRLGRRMSEIERLLEKARDGPAGRFLADTARSAALRRVLERWREAVAESPAGPRRSVALEELDRTMGRLAERLERLERRLESARGTAGRVLYDDAIRAQAELLRARIDSARVELITDPLRWVSFGIF